MAVDLIKRGQTIDLTKGRAGLQKVTIGLSWGSTSKSMEKKKEDKRGFLAKLFDKAMGDDGYAPHPVTGKAMDIDSSVILVTDDGRALDTIYFGKQRSTCGSVYHSGDDRTGKDQKGSYDNEEIQINLATVPANVKSIVFVANIYQGESKGQHFGQVQGSYIRVMQTSNREEFIRYDLADDFNGMRGIEVGQLYRHNGEWKFRAVGQGTTSDSLNKLVQAVTR